MEDHPIVKGMTAFVVFFKWLEAVVCIWFLRLFTPFCIGWGLWDLWFYMQGDHSQQRTDDAAIRTTAGVMLALCWLFLARRKGPWTINKNGVLERWPFAGRPLDAPHSASSPSADEPRKKPRSPRSSYVSPTADKYR
jgi:hypothetical protein